MAQTFYTAENLGMPFRYLRELAMVVSSDGNRVRNSGRKLVLVLGGECRHRFENGDSQTLKTGDVLVTTSAINQYYEVSADDDSARLHAMVIIFDSRYFSVNADSSEIKSGEHNGAIQFITAHFSENVHLKNILDASLFEMVAQIRHEAELALPGFRWRITSLCASGIVQLARKMTEQFGPEIAHVSSHQRGVFLVSCAKEYLLKHLTQEVSMSDVAEHLKVSNGHLAHTFKRVAGQSLFTYFKQLRLEQAKLQLLNSEKNVTEIAIACGFSSTTLFCRNFKQYTGQTPLNYRDEFSADVE